MRRQGMIGLAVCAAFAAGPGHAASDPLAGTWSGGGYVQPKDGAREKVSCRVTYSRRSDKVYGVSATCASTSVKIQQTGELLHVSGNRYVGDFHNPQYDVSGRVRVVVNGGSQSVTFSSAHGGGAMTLRRR